MTFEILLILGFINMICRCIIFAKHNIRWWFAMIPGYNKYRIGKMANCKKIGIINAILHPLLIIYFFFCFGLELWIIDNYAVEVQVPTDGVSSSVIQVAVPENIANITIWSKYILIGFIAITVIFWAIMAWKFTMSQNKNPWWIVLWATISTIPYIYFAATKDYIVDGVRYTIKRVEVNE